MSTAAGTLTIDIVAGLARLQDDMEKGVKTVESSMKGIDSAVNLAKHALEALGVAFTVDALVNHLKNTLDVVDATAKMADRFGIATEKLVGLQAAARSAGIADLNPLLDHLSRTVLDAATGGEKAGDAFARLGLNAGELAKLAPDKQFELIGARLLTVGNVTERNALSMEIFGKRAGEVVNIFADGQASIAAWTSDVENMGAALNRMDSAKIELANDAMARAKLASQGLWNEIAVRLAPVIAGVANDFADASKKTHGFRDEVTLLFEKLAPLAAFLGDAIHYAHVTFNLLLLLLHEVANSFIQVFGDIAAGINVAATAMAKIGLISKESAAAVREFLSPITTMAADDEKAMHKLRMEFVELTELAAPGEKIKAWFKTVEKNSEETAKKIAEDRKKLNESTGDMGADPRLARHLQQEENDYKKHLAKQVEELHKSLLTGTKLEELEHKKRMQLLFAAQSQGIITDQEFFALREQMELEHQAKLGDIFAEAELRRRQVSEMNWQQQLAYAGNSLQAITQLMHSHSRTQFEIGKTAAIAQATIAAITSAIEAYKSASAIPFVGWILGPVAAAAALAMGMSNVQKIRSTQFEGGGDTGSASFGSLSVGSASAPNVQQPPPQLTDQLTAQSPAAAAPQRIVNIQLKGEGAPSDSYIRDKLIPALNDALGDGATLDVMAV